MLYNKHGKQFSHKVSIARDPNLDPVFRYMFPVKRGNIVEKKWASKIRPIKSLTKQLQGLNLKRNIDYMIDYDVINQTYDYYFANPHHQTIFSLVNGGSTQPYHMNHNQHMNIECQNCKHTFPAIDAVYK